jgi:nucleoside-diphosphate-sugar epimerase
MRVLVTGGAGYIGDAVVEHLLKNHDDVLVVDRLIYSDEYTRDDVCFRRLDITSPDFIDEIRSERFDAIIHLAALVGDGACKIEPQRTIDVNVTATKKLVDFVKEHQPHTKFIFASTCSVYGSMDGFLNEDSPTNPLSLYAETKLEAEKYVRDLPNYVIFRLGTIFGLSTKFGRIRADLVANVMTFMALDGKPIQVNGGEQWRPLVHVEDIGEIMAKSLYLDVRGTYIINHKNYCIGEIADKVVSLLGKGSVRVLSGTTFEDLRNYKVDSDKLTRAGLVPYRKLDEGILDIAQFVASGRIKNPWLSKYHNEKFLKENPSWKNPL